jgi:hypothetical protein
VTMQGFWHNDGLTIVEPRASITMFGRTLFIRHLSLFLCTWLSFILKSCFETSSYAYTGRLRGLACPL